MSTLAKQSGRLRGAGPSAIQESPGNIEEYQSARPIGAQETARMWRHRECDGVELFRGTYVKYQAARHYHTVPAIGIVARGAMTSFHRGDTHTFSADTAFLINPEEVHSPGPAMAAGWVLRVFYFERRFYQELSENVGHNPLRFWQAVVKDAELTNSLLALHRSMEAHHDPLEIDSMFVSIFALLAERYAFGRATPSRVADEKGKIDRVKRYIEESYASRLTLDDLADVGQLSPFHLLRTFKKAVGLTPHAYLNQTRIEAAMRLLRAGKAIADVAFDTGFTDQSHFTRNFRRMMGVTPGQFHARTR